jgi:hypothetical protein
MTYPSGSRWCGPMPQRAAGAARRGADVGKVSRNAPGGSPDPRHAPVPGAARSQRCREAGTARGLIPPARGGSEPSNGSCGDAAAEGPPGPSGRTLRCCRD